MAGLGLASARLLSRGGAGDAVMGVRGGRALAAAPERPALPARLSPGRGPGAHGRAVAAARKPPGGGDEPGGHRACEPGPRGHARVARGQSRVVARRGPGSGATASHRGVERFHAPGGVSRFQGLASQAQVTLRTATIV